MSTPKKDDSYKTIKKKLDAFFEDRISAKESAFQETGSKLSGITEGYIAKKQTDVDGTTFMIKKAIRKDTDKREESSRLFKARKLGKDIPDDLKGASVGLAVNSVNFVNEFVTAPLYKRILYDRTPVIAAVESDDKDDDGLLFRSKFLHGFKTLSQFTEGASDASIGNENIDELGEVEGAEKLFASMLTWGEIDLHAGNIGIMDAKNDEGKNCLVYAKIDHGFSAVNFFTNPDDLLKSFVEALEYNYYLGTIAIDVDKLKESIDQITNTSDDEIRNIVGSRLHQLKKMGFKVSNLDFFHVQNEINADGDWDYKFESFKDFNALEKHYVDNLTNQMKVMRKVSDRLDIISKINYSDTFEYDRDWKKTGVWLLDVGEKDPIKWAIDNGKTIGDEDPIVWAIENNKEIEGIHPIIWAEDANLKIDELEPDEYAKEHNIDVPKDDVSMRF